MYLTDEKNVLTVLEVAQISLQELEDYVGRFPKTHYRFAGLLKGEATLTEKQLILRHHFTKKLIVAFDL